MKPVGMNVSILASCVFSVWIMAESYAEEIISGKPIAEFISSGVYDCEGVKSSDRSLNLGQFIEGKYYNWKNYTREIEGQWHTVCVAEISPSTKLLNLAEAQLFLLKSQHVGVVRPEYEKNSQAEANSTFDYNVDESSAIATPLLVLIEPDENVAAALSSPGRDQFARLGRPNSVNLPTGTINNDSGVYPETTEQEDTSSNTLFDPERVRESASVDGNDERVRAGTGSYPYNTFGKLIIGFSKDRITSCTGTLVGPYTVITAGHCVHNRDFGGFPSFVSFTPGQNQTSFDGAVSRPFGTYYADAVVTNARWGALSGGSTISTPDAQYDYAALFFDEPIDFTSTYMPLSFDDTRDYANNAGYPGIVQENPNQGIWFDAGDETTQSELIIRSFQVREFDIDVSGGNSGGPFWYYDGTNRSLTGVVSYSKGGLAGGVWLGGANSAQIASWVNWTPDDGIGPIAGADSKDGLRTSFVFSSALSEVGSYLRFANADVSSGNVSLTISDTFTGEIISNWQSPTIAPFAALQFAMGDIESASQPSINPTNHTAYSIAIESTFEGYFQHVLYSAAGESLTNVTGCEAGLSGDTSLLMNMHTTDIGSYPSNIVFHNVGPSSSTPEMTIYDAANGDELGTIFPLSPIPPDGSILFDVSAIQDALDFIPSSQPHLNLRLSGAFRGYVQHFVDNEGSGVVTNMTSKCNIGFF